MTTEVRSDALTDHQWATEVMRIINAQPDVNLGAWSNAHRDQILHHLLNHRREPGFLELVVSDFMERRWRLHAAPGLAPGVRLREHQVSYYPSIPEPDGLAAINDALARLGDGTRP